jgi:hypothetical protein
MKKSSHLGQAFKLQIRVVKDNNTIISLVSRTSSLVIL